MTASLIACVAWPLQLLSTQIILQFHYSGVTANSNNCLSSVPICHQTLDPTQQCSRDLWLDLGELKLSYYIKHSSAITKLQSMSTSAVLAFRHSYRSDCTDNRAPPPLPSPKSSSGSLVGVLCWMVSLILSSLTKSNLLHLTDHPPHLPE